MGPSPSVPPSSPRLLRAGAALAVLFLAYVALGFLAAPALVRRVVTQQASKALHREVTIGAVRVNPLALSVTLEALTVKHRGGAPFLRWDSLYVRLAPWRIVSGYVGLAEIRLVRPSVHVAVGADGRLSFEDLLETSPGGAAAASPSPPPRREGGIGVAIRHLAVEDARVLFHDETRRPAFDAALGPLTFRLDSFQTKGGGDSPYSFAGTTDAGETFRWSGTIRTAPVRSAGALAFEKVRLPRYAPYFQDDYPVELRDGTLDLETRYELEWGAERHVLRTSAGKLELTHASAGPLHVADPPVKLARAQVTGLAVDALARTARVEEVALHGAALHVVRDPDGTFELARMAPRPRPAPPAPPPPWTWTIDRVAVVAAAVTLEDRTTPTPAVLPLSDVQVRIDGLTSTAGAASPLELSAVWAGAGRLRVHGPVQPLARKGTLDVDAAALALAPLAPYLEPATTARLAGGSAGAKLKVSFDTSAAAPQWSATGDVRVEALSLTERGNEDLLRWRALELAGLDAGSSPPHVTLRRVVLTEPRVKAYVWEDHTSSVERARRTSAAPRQAGEAPEPASSAGAWRTAIGAVEVVRGRAQLLDRSVAPTAVVSVTRAEGRVTGLSSDPRKRSAVDVRLEVEGASPVRVTGTLNPLQNAAYTDLQVTSDGVDLSPLDPYAGKYLGYRIQKGKLDLDLRYRIVNRDLAATNVVRLNQLTLGDATESPDATKLPVRLALALLRDPDGVILLDVPIDGNLDDPDFHFGKVIWRAVLNVLTKVATSPFRALAALVGGGDDADLSLVEFAPGAADLSQAAQSRVAMLARSLSQRPALQLELEGSADAERDGPALRRVALERSLRRAKAAALRPPPASLDEVTLAPDERVRLVRAAYEASLAGPAARKDPAVAAAEAPPTPQQMEERLATLAEVPPDAYVTLAAERAQRARSALAAAGVDQARLFLVEGSDRATKEKGARVYFTVR